MYIRMKFDPKKMGLNALAAARNPFFSSNGIDLMKSVWLVNSDYENNILVQVMEEKTGLSMYTPRSCLSPVINTKELSEWM